MSLAWARGIELICVLLSALLAAGLLPGASPATCAAPFLFGVAVRVGYPPAGKGVGQPAPSLAEGLEVVSGSELGAADRGGEGDGDGSAGSRREGRSPVEPWHLLPKASLAAGKVHVLVFCGASLGPRIVTALRRVQAAYVSSRALPVSFLLISRASADEVGAGAPIARDATGATSDSYLSAFCGRLLRPVPHAFVVGADGAIAWHGHSSRRQFTLALSAALRRAAGLGAEGDGGEAAADGSAEKKKAE
uniref:Alkyl hydroperoxide reductase subunit C/ Thiol specific antioxidant domain-containing protein n=1 Tax=Emiliania huxleyi (strain CCMP1516) TaxID=280463 RepID=A0A0D3IQN4_EMIH1